MLVYDLGESSTMHQNKEIEKNKMSVLRTPTYMTGTISFKLSRKDLAKKVVNLF